MFSLQHGFIIQDTFIMSTKKNFFSARAQEDINNPIM